MRAPLSDRYIHALKPGRNYTVWDTTFPSFGVRIGKHRKTFTVMTGSTRRRVTIGRYPKMSLQEARRAAREYLDNPPPDTPTFHEALKSFDQLHLQPNTRATTAKQFHRWISVYVAPTIATKQLGDINPRDLTTIFNGMKETPAQANNAYTATKLFFNWCVSQHLIAVSPLHGIKTPFKKATRERLLSDEEVRVVWRASYHDSVLGQVIRSLILSGQRLNQIASFDPAWVHDDRITFPASVMKTDVPHTMPLTAELAKHLPSSPSRANNLSSEMIKFRRALAFAHAASSHARPFAVGHFTLHDFRRYFSSTMARLQVPIDVTEALLSHRSGTRSPIQRTYDRYDRLEPMRDALLKYEAHVLAAVAGD